MYRYSRYCMNPYCHPDSNSDAIQMMRRESVCTWTSHSTQLPTRSTDHPYTEAVGTEDSPTGPDFSVGSSYRGCVRSI